jgi:hypothetical protein
LIGEWKEVESGIKIQLLFGLLGFSFLFEISFVLLKISVQIVFAAQLNIRKKYFIIGAEVVEFLPRQDSIILIDVVDRLLFGPEDIPLFRVFCPSIASILESFLDTDPDLSLIANV